MMLLKKLELMLVDTGLGRTLKPGLPRITAPDEGEVSLDTKIGDIFRRKPC